MSDHPSSNHPGATTSTGWHLSRGRYVILVVALPLLLAAATWFAWRQPPHPDMFRPISPWDIAKPDCWLYPLERNAFKRLVVRGKLNALFNLPGTERLWAIGSGGLILHSPDGGRTWQQQRPPLPQATETARSLGRQAGSPGSPWWPQAHAAEMQSQEPPGVSSPARQALVRKPTEATPADTPEQQKSGEPALQPADADLNAVYFTDARRGWAVGGAGTILATGDGGNTWTPQASSTRAWLYSVTFLPDGRRGWAVGENGTILATDNGGNTWTPQASGTNANLASATFLTDGRHGWAVGEAGTILATDNGGNTWTPQASGTNADLASVTFLPDGRRGWAVGENGTILATANGGNTWPPQASGTQARIFSVTFLPDGQRGWAVGDNGTILATANGGNTWTPQASRTRAWLFSVTFLPDGRRGWAVGNNGTILATGADDNRWESILSYRCYWPPGTSSCCLWVAVRWLA